MSFQKCSNIINGINYFDLIKNIKIFLIMSFLRTCFIRIKELSENKKYTH